MTTQKELESVIKKASEEIRSVPAWKRSADVESELARLRASQKSSAEAMRKPKEPQGRR